MRNVYVARYVPKTLCYSYANATLTLYHAYANATLTLIIPTQPGVLSASGPIRIVGGGVGVLFASRPAIEDMNSKLYVRIIKLTF